MKGGRSSEKDKKKKADKNAAPRLYETRHPLIPPGQEVCRLYHYLDDETGDGRGEF